MLTIISVIIVTEHEEDQNWQEMETATTLTFILFAVTVINILKADFAESSSEDTNQSSDILQHSQNRPTGDRWLKF